jgi:hypothetical protein
MSTEREQDLAEHRARFHPMSERFRSSAHDFRAGHDAATARAQERIAVLEREVEKALQAYDAEVLGRRAEVQGCHAEMLTLRTANVAAERANATLVAELAELKRDCSCCIMNKERAVAAEAREAALRESMTSVQCELLAAFGGSKLGRPDYSAHGIGLDVAKSWIERLAPTRQRRIDPPTWRTGTKVGNTIYRNDAFAGSAVTPEIATELVRDANSQQRIDKLQLEIEREDKL